MSNHFLYYSKCNEKVSESTTAHWRSIEKSRATAYNVPWERTESDSEDDTNFDFNDDHPVENDEESAVLPDVPLAPLNAGLPMLLNGNFGNIEVIKRQKGITHTDSEYAETKLLKILEDANCPNYLFGDILDWAADARRRGYNFEATCKTRGAVIGNLEKRFNLKFCRPEQVTVAFPQDNLFVDITRFNFLAQFHSLITDKSLTGDITQLDVPQDDPFGKYESPDGRLGAFNSGSWYQKAWANQCEPDSDDWMCPIIYGCDETHVGSSQGRASVTPLIFTLSIFNESLRNKKTSWRPLGYVYDIAQHGKAMHTEGRTIPRKMTPEEKSSRYHQMIGALLETHLKVQQEGGIEGIPVELGNFRKENVNVKVPVGMIIGDMQGGDKHCCSKIGYSKDLARLCRKCNISGDESGNPLVKCKKMSMNKIKQYVTDNEFELLKEISQNNVKCAWFECDFGGCKYGVFSAAMPIEALHAVEGGIFPMALKILYTIDLKPANCEKLDILIRRFCHLDRQKYMDSGGNKDMPRLLFKDGVSSLEKLSKSYIVGIMLSIVVVSLTDDGKELLEVEFTPSKGERHVGIKRLNDMRYVFSMLLCYWSWLKQDTFWKIGDRHAKQRAEWSIRKMLSELIALWPREKGNGWFTPKIHEQGHVPDDIETRGSPRNSYSGVVENAHLIVKAQALRTQKNRSLLDIQIGTRSAEAHIINYAYERICVASDPPGDATDPGTGPRGSRGRVSIRRGTGRRPQVSFAWKPGGCTGPPPPSLALDAIREYDRHFFCPGSDPNLVVTRNVFTEYLRDGITFRAHPLYRSEQAWHDWVMFRYEKSDNDKARNKTYREESHTDAVFAGDDPATSDDHHYAPGKILAFVEADNGQLLAVVLCCAFKHVRSSVFTTHWKVEYVDAATTRPMVLLLDVNAIVRHCCMVPENSEAHGYHEIWDKDRWAREFV